MTVDNSYASIDKECRKLLEKNGYEKQYELGGVVRYRKDDRSREVVLSLFEDVSLNIKLYDVDRKVIGQTDRSHVRFIEEFVI